jgi:uncharacterized protein (DUF1800 family)
VWHSNRYDAIGRAAYVTEQLDGSLASISATGTTIGNKALRDVTSRRQLEAALLEFWFNHFNISTESLKQNQVVKTIRGRMVGHHQNVAILPYLLGDFGTMLLETAKSPSMLDYLDNRINFEAEVVNDKVFGGNDNYAREVMELHTIGVNGGYNELDITEAARILTGWSVTNDAYFFKQARHDFNAKTVMGVPYPAGGGEEEGVAFLDFLANHPSAPDFLAGKLVARFINEIPPAGAKAAVQAAYGPNRDLGAMTTAMLNHPDFLAEANFRAKVKPPSRFVSSGLLAMGAKDFADWSGIEADLVDGIVDAGETPYVVGPPTGYPEQSDFWVSSASMLSRFTIAERIAYHPPLIAKLRARSSTLGNDTIDTVDAVAAEMVPGGLSNDSRVAVLDHVAANAANSDGRVSAAAHLIMCSPEFVRY